MATPHTECEGVQAGNTKTYSCSEQSSHEHVQGVVYPDIYLCKRNKPCPKKKGNNNIVANAWPIEYSDKEHGQGEVIRSMTRNKAISTATVH